MIFTVTTFFVTVKSLHNIVLPSRLFSWWVYHHDFFRGGHHDFFRDIFYNY
nr:MAG TPA: hypothetical protein [Caudoviricetes sp.]